MMHKSQLRVLLAVNLRLLNPQLTDRLRKKGASGPALSKKLMRQFYLNALMFLGIYGLTMLAFDFSKLPGMFTFYVALFILLGISQSISGIYNVFFAGNDLVEYLPLPFRNQEIFMSKILVVIFNTVPFTIPLLLIFIMTATRAGIFVVLGVLMAVLMYGLILSLLLCLCALIVFGLTKLTVFRTHQKMVMNVMLGLNAVLVLVGLYFMNRGSSSDTGTQVDRAALPLLIPIFKVFTTPLTMTSLLTWASLIVISLILFALTGRFVLTHLAEQLMQVNSVLVATPPRRHSRQHNRNKILRTYQFQLLKEPSLALQLFTDSILLPLILVGTVFFSGTAPNFSRLSLNWLGVWFVSGMAGAIVNVNQTSLVGNLISLDKMNFDFVRALPIPMSRYLRQKFYLGYWFQIMINGVMVLVVGIAGRAPLALDLALILGAAWGTYLAAQHYFKRDYQLRLTNWTNVTQLFNRGGGNLGLMLNLLACSIVGVLTIVIYSVLIQLFAAAAMLINIIVLVGVGIISAGLVWHYYKTFWQQLD
ncbi:ABC transporter permease [Lactiplantibacillus plantarum]|nr:ABC transporter permease [Lactiplantibacillus plantarum]MCB7158407.1 ABC transporter permease [Lactiplantibacillus plantarum]MCB7168463.1 ABC transporter permease [Lactiplantibacillus plantarum]MCB7173107.1 ABC transporter permease [Lactiplantibacillus plantarum]MCB7210260.1 ABC transporter permease [Lactiplantibacillus plantarum]